MSDTINMSLLDIVRDHFHLIRPPHKTDAATNMNPNIIINDIGKKHVKHRSKGKGKDRRAGRANKR